MRNESQIQSTGQTQPTPRHQRTASAVIAQYIQDLTRPVVRVPCAPTA